MGDLGEFSLAVRLFLRAYRWRRLDPVPWAQPRRPAREARVALVTSAGLVAPGQEPFDLDYRGGDPSFRVLPADVEVARLEEHHRSDTFDHVGIQSDPNLAFPLDRLHELASDGLVGEVAPRHVSFMGSITAPGRLTRETAPAAADLLVEDEVDLAVLVPV